MQRQAKFNLMVLSSLMLLVCAILLAACSLIMPGNAGEGSPAGAPAPGEGVAVGPAGAQATSRDGRLSLSFPAGAVGNDVTVGIEPVPAEQWPDIMADLDPAAIVYRLEPSGLSFAEPVPFEMTMDLEIGDDGSVAAPVVVVVDDAGNGEPVGLDVRLDRAAGTAIVTGTIRHFSWIVGHDGGLAVGLEEIAPRERTVGAPWEADVTVRNVFVGVVSDVDAYKIVLKNIVFEALGAVEVVGTQSHAGFSLEAGAERKLDFPVPRWQCREPGEGSYRVVATAMIGGGLFSTLTRYEAKSINAIKNFWGLDRWVGDLETNYAVIAEVPVKCLPAVYEASTQSGTLSVSGRVANLEAQFTLNGAFQGGTAVLSFQPGITVTEPETGDIYSSGSFTFSGGGSGATVSGEGSYSVEGKLGSPLSLSFTGEGCATPGTCAPTNGTILLTPVQP